MANKSELTQEERQVLAKKLEGVAVSIKKKTIYRCKYGIDDGILKSNAETGSIFNITGEAVRNACEEIEVLFTK